ncbi:recombinase family protein [Yoonia maritima]|nr:recombinase family protein [Yoonia maritima]
MSCLVLQREKLMAYGVVPDRIFSDTRQKKRDNQIGLRNYLKALRAQSTLIVLTLDRLGDHTLDIVELGGVFCVARPV